MLHFYLQILLYVISIQKWDGGGGSIDSNVSNIRSNPLSHVYLPEGMLPTIAWEKKDYI